MKNERTPALVDMDDVLAGFSEHLMSELRRRDPSFHGGVEDITDWYYSSFSAQRVSMIREIYNEPGFFAKLPVVTGSIMAYLAMKEEGLNPRVCTAPMPTNPTCEIDKINWLEEHFVPHVGHGIIDEIYITADKHLIDGSVLVDDNPDIKNSHLAPWKHIVFDRPHNRSVIDKPRIMNWTDGEYMKIVRGVIDRSL